jgi:phosphoglucomutase
VFDFPLIKSFLSRKDFSLVFDAMHAVTGPYAKRILVQVSACLPVALHAPSHCTLPA